MNNKSSLYVNSTQTDNYSKYIKTYDNHSNVLFYSVLVYFLMFLSNDTYLFGTNKSLFIVSIPRYIILIFCLIGLIYFIHEESIQKRKKQIAMYCVLLLTFIAVSIVNKELVNRTIIKILFMTGGFLFCVILNFLDFSIAFRNALVFISVSSNILWILAYIVPGFVMQLPQMENTAGVRFATIFIAGIDLRAINSIAIRSVGIYWEPGVYQMYLNMAIFFELFVEEKPRKRYLLAYCIALFSTFSTTGYIAFLWTMLTYILFGGNKQQLSKYSRWMVILPFITILFFLAITGTTVGRQVFGKAANLKEGTTMVRLASFFASIDIARSHPLNGVGMENVSDYMYKITMASDLYHGWTRQNTNTLLYQFAAHGCIFGGLFLLGTSSFGRVFKRGKIFTLFVFVLIWIFYMGENLMVSIFPYILIFYGIGSTSTIYRKEESNKDDYKESRYIIY